MVEEQQRRVPVSSQCSPCGGEQAGGREGGRHTVVNVLAYWRGVLGQEEGRRSCVEDAEHVEHVAKVSSDGPNDWNAIEEAANDGDELGSCCGRGEKGDEQDDEDGWGTHFA
jgi:hypothetical protein